MKNIILKGIAGIFILTISCNNPDSIVVPSSDQELSNRERRQIEDEIRRYEELVRKGEFSSIPELFINDIVFIRPNMKNIVGIDSLMLNHYSNVPAIPGFWKTAVDIGGSGRVAYTFGYYGFFEDVPNGKYMEIRIKQDDGSWPVSRLIWNEISNNEEN